MRHLCTWLALLAGFGLALCVPGNAADLVLWEQDPLDDVEALLTPAIVMKAGAVVSMPA